MLYFLRMFVISDLFFFVICPLDPISNGTQSADQPFSFKSFVKSKYLALFLRFALSIFFSKLTVS